MPKPLNADWSAVRVLAVAVGVREAARQMGISEDAVRQRSKREGWMACPKTVAQRALAKPFTSVSPNAVSPAHALARPRARARKGDGGLLPRNGPLVTVLISSITSVRFESTVEHDQEFSHCRSEGEFGRFASRSQSQIKAAQDWVVTRGD
jgi:hypothetical protein